MANNAFDAMNSSAGDKINIGGSITVSEYEQNMDPAEQLKYERMLSDELMELYQSTPGSGKIDFKSWLKTLDIDRITEQAMEYDSVINSPNGNRKLISMEGGRQLENAGVVQKLAHLHTGRIEDVIDIVLNTGEYDYFQNAILNPEYNRFDDNVTDIVKRTSQQGQPPFSPVTNTGE